MQHSRLIVPRFEIHHPGLCDIPEDSTVLLSCGLQLHLRSDPIDQGSRHFAQAVIGPRIYSFANTVMSLRA